MTKIFANPPLVELIAEVRWTMLQVSPQGPPLPPTVPLPVVPVVASAHEQLFLDYATKVSADGYKRIERLLPTGFPMLSYQPVFRYRPETGSTLYQLGAGLFTANATPPYESWHEFSPVVHKGLNILFQCLSETDQRGIKQLSLRYIDAFKGTLQAGKTLWEFVNDTLGIKIQLPDPLTEGCVAKSAIKVNCHFSIPVKLGALEVKVSEGLVNNDPAYIMDTIVKIDQGISPDIDVLMMQLNAAHDVIHKMFFAISEPLHNTMRMIEGNK